MAGDGRSEEDPGGGFVHISRVMAAWLAKEIYRDFSIGPPKSGYPDLDLILGDFGNNLIVIGGQISVGKSTLALNVCASAARNGSHVGVFSLDLSQEQLMGEIHVFDRQGKLYQGFDGIRRLLKEVPLDQEQ